MNRGGRTLVRALAIAAVAAIAGTAVPASATAKVNLTYKNFKKTKGLKLNGSARKHKASKALRLVRAGFDQSGSAFMRKKLIDPTKSFRTQFRTYLHAGSEDPADGLTFTLHSGQATALGWTGTDLGYGGISGKNVAIEHDIYESLKSSLPSEHIGVLSDGKSYEHLALEEAPFSLKQQRVRTWIVYSAETTTLKVYLGKKKPRPAEPVLTHGIDLGAYFDGKKVRAGFTAATGGERVIADVLYWKFRQP